MGNDELDMETKLVKNPNDPKGSQKIPGHSRALLAAKQRQPVTTNQVLSERIGVSLVPLAVQ